MMPTMTLITANVTRIRTLEGHPSLLRSFLAMVHGKGLYVVFFSSRAKIADKIVDIGGAILRLVIERREVETFCRRRNTMHLRSTGKYSGILGILVKTYP